MPIVENDEIAGEDSLHDRQGGATVRQAPDPSEPRIALCAADLYAVEVGQQRNAIEQFDGQGNAAAALAGFQ